MRIFIRVDASTEIGTGHVMRCLTYAHEQKKRNNDVEFICRKSNGDCIELIKQNGFKVHMLPEVNESLWKFTKKYWKTDAEQTIEILKKYSVDLIVIDHYSIEEKWEKMIRSFVKEIMVIDDLANRKHDCDTLLDQNYYLDMNHRYEGLVPKHAKLLLGPKFALLRDEFKTAHNMIKPFNGKVERLFIFFGGSDPTNETEKVLRAIKPLIAKYNLSVDVIVGNTNKKRKKIQELCKSINGVNFYCQINNIAELMANADLAIGAGGTTIWERVYLNLPSIVISVANNQDQIAETLHQKGIIYYLGKSSDVTEKMIMEELEKLINNPSLINRIINNCSSFFSNH